VKEILAFTLPLEKLFNASKWRNYPKPGLIGVSGLTGILRLLSRYAACVGTTNRLHDKLFLTVFSLNLTP
jgi:hypothetical protein